ncbi:MAG: protein kinase [Acidobacteriota bacterium]
MSSSNDPRRFATAVPVSTGATSQVYRAHDPTRGTDVALKYLRHDDPSLVQRLLREADAQQRLDHPAICPIYEVGDRDGQPFLIMPFVEGEELDVAARYLDLPQRIDLVCQIADGLQAAHDAGLVHRDIKPANVLVRIDDGGRPRPTIIDFGLVWDPKITAMTHVGQVVGTPAYLAPEQVRGRGNIDARTDVYGLGAVLYQLLTGFPPFADEGSNNLDLFVRTLERAPTPPRRFVPELPSALQNVTLKCLEKDPARRYPSMRALIADLERARAGRAVTARPPSLAHRAYRVARRNRAWFVPLVIALVATVALVVTQQVRANQRIAYVQHYGPIGKDLGWSLRAVYMGQRRDVRADKARVRTRIAELEGELPTLSGGGRGPAHYAIGRGYLALQIHERAVDHLERAWAADFRTPDVAYALGLALGQRYAEARLEANRIGDAQLRAARREAARATYHDRVLAFLERGRSAEAASAAYVEALIAYHEQQDARALRRVAQARAELPWLYETYIVEGNVHARACRRVAVHGEPDAGATDCAAAAAAYERAIASAGSDVRAYLGLCGMDVSLVQARSHAGAPHEAIARHHTRAYERCQQAMEIVPDDPRPHQQLALVQRYWAYSEQLLNQRDSTGALAEGLRHARRAVALAPDDPDVLTTLGDIQLEYASRGVQLGVLGDPRPLYDLAITNFRRALVRQPDHTLARSWLGFTLDMRARSENAHGLDPIPTLARAAHHLRWAVRQQPDGYLPNYLLANAFYSRSEAEFRLGRPFGDSAQLAQRHYARAWAASPKAAWAAGELGLAYAQRGYAAFLAGSNPDALIEQATRSLERASVLNPRVVFFRTMLIRTLLDGAIFRMERGFDPRTRLTQASTALTAFADWDVGTERGDLNAAHLDLASARAHWQLLNDAPDAALTALRPAGLHLDGLTPGGDFSTSQADYLLLWAYARHRTGLDPLPLLDRFDALMTAWTSAPRPSRFAMRGSALWLRSLHEPERADALRARAEADWARAADHAWTRPDVERWQRWLDPEGLRTPRVAPVERG